MGYGDVWTFVALDADTKLVLSWHIGWCEPEDAYDFISDIRARLDNRVQLSTASHRMYLYAIDHAFKDGAVDYGMIVKQYGTQPDESDRSSPPKYISMKAKRIQGNPDMSKVSTSYVERQNLTMRVNMRRFTRLTNGFSKKFENPKYFISLHFMCYYFVKTHKTLTTPYPSTPAMAEGITDHILTTGEIVKLTCLQH